jgi:glucosamine--fructose-6-phosphate aminotransferase (isomerizing)
MLKEIHEQPRSIRQTITGRMDAAAGTVRLGGLEPVAADLKRIQRIVMLGCGTSWHAGLVGRHVIERLVGMPVTVEYASEYRYRPSVPQDDTLAIAISQSGETADTLQALRVARRAGACVIGIVNVVGSTIAREADAGLYLHAGPEIGVASTKAFTSQLTALLLLGLSLAAARRPAPIRARRMLRALQEMPGLVERTLETLDTRVRNAAERYVEARHALYLGRGISYPVALEGALKLKEISYMHGEGYPAAEMKHGPIALVEPGMPVVCIAPRDHTHAKVVSNMQEVKARGARIIAVTTEGHDPLRGVADEVFAVPAVPTLLSPILTVLPLQLFAYHVATLRGLDVDRPRNLAKSVTVE